jgi:hypothetical protein
VARILIADPTPELVHLFSQVVRRLGHEPLVPGDEVGDHDADLFLFEPGSEDAVATAETLRRTSPDIPLVCVSIFPPGERSRALAPAAYLVKPFSLSALEAVLTNVLGGPGEPGQVEPSPSPLAN